MKYVVLLCDGMADLKRDDLGGKTPMGCAKKPNMDKLAKSAEIGLVKTVTDGIKPGSDVANLSVLGYDPSIYYSGRSPLEAGSIGIDMKPTDVSFRANLVTLSDEPNYEDKTILDYCADDISTEEAEILVKFLAEKLDTDEFHYYSGVSYRHCLIWNNGTLDVGTLTPPHDITGKPIKNYLGFNDNSRPLLEMMKKSYELLKDHPVNKARIERGLRPANSLWFWGEGVRKSLMPFTEKYGLKGSMISAVDLLKGIGKFTGMDVINVEGATGYIDTNFSGKAQAAIKTLKDGADFVYIHVEAPDECGHRFEVANKVKSIELIDELILGPILEAFGGEELRVLICPDHPTPLELRTHTNAPVPYLIYDSTKPMDGVDCFSEESAEKTGRYVEKGFTLMEHFLAKQVGKMNEIKAAIFDLDGTLFDSMHMWSDIDRRFFEKRKLAMPEDYKLSIAHLGLYETAVYTKNRFGFSDTPEEIIAEWSEMTLDFYSNEVTLKKGAGEYLRRLKSRGILLAVATANGRELFEPALRHTGIIDLFDAVVSSDEVERQKGFPDIYLLACKKLGGVLPVEAVVFEDILLGIKGAADGGFHTVAVYDETSAENEAELRALAERYIRDFTELL